MVLEQKKVSLTIETDWLTFDYMDRLSKTLETIHDSIANIQKETSNRFEELREWTIVDPTEWLEDIEDEMAQLEKEIQKQVKLISSNQQLFMEKQEYAAQRTTAIQTNIEGIMTELQSIQQKLVQVEGIATALSTIQQQQNEMAMRLQGIEQLIQVKQSEELKFEKALKDTETRINQQIELVATSIIKQITKAIQQNNQQEQHGAIQVNEQEVLGDDKEDEKA